MDKSFRKSDAVTYGWDAMKRNFSLWLFVQLVLIFLFFSINKMIEAIYPEGMETILNWGLVATLFLILVWIALRVHDGRPSAVTEIFSSGIRYLRFLGALALYHLIVFGGLILLVIPGFIWAVQYFFAPYIVLDEGLGPVAALRRSSELTRGIRTELFLFHLLLYAINVAGLLPLALGLFATVPTTMVATVWVYRHLQARTPATAAVPPSPAGAGAAAPPA